MNRFCDVVNLIAVEKGINANGFNTEIEHGTTVFADIQSVKRAEFYEAMRSGLKLTNCIVVNKLDFDYATYDDGNNVKHKPSKVEVNGEKYKIVRTYQTSDDLLEIVCVGE